MRTGCGPQVSRPAEVATTGGRNCGLVWSVGAGICGVRRTQHARLTGFRKLLGGAAFPGAPRGSFSASPLNRIVVGRKGWVRGLAAMHGAGRQVVGRQRSGSWVNFRILGKFLIAIFGMLLPSKR
jgi:hypothetical protein